MSAGFSVWNDNSYLVVEENYTNSTFIKRVLVSTVASPTAWRGTRAEITLPAGTDSVAFSAPFYVALYYTIPQADGTMRCMFIADVPPGGKFFVYAFGSPYPKESKYGIEVFKPDGVSVAFSSAYDYMRVVDVINEPDFRYITGTRAAPAGRTYAVLPGTSSSENSVSILDVGGGGLYYRIQTSQCAGYSVNGSVISWRAVLGYNPPPLTQNTIAGGYYAAQLSSQALIVDVTYLE